MTTKTKVCKSCHKRKPKKGFYRNDGMADGRLNRCIECQKKYMREYRAKRKEERDGLKV